MSFPAFPAPTADQLATFEASKVAGIRAYRDAAAVRLLDGSVAVPTLAQAKQALEFEAEFGWGCGIALSEDVKVDAAGNEVSRERNFVIRSH